MACKFSGHGSAHELQQAHLKMSFRAMTNKKELG
jgi:hypothetical protein